ncbi:MAG: co-chaperone YbbN [Gammaproteobacteria bacterium]|nr:co-chaperone YbbN [Gammaproteobacteria bacterium]
MGQFAFDVDAAGFEAAVLEASQRVPVVVDFWAPWCGPCQSLKPILEKLAGEFGGKFLLARVNTDENQELAMQFGIRGIPDVKAFYRGQVIDQFTGALPESGVREFLARILPSPAEELRQQAAAQRAAGNDTQALETLGEASRLDPGNEQVRIDAAEILLDAERVAEARQLLDSLSASAALDERAQRLRARMDFAPAGEAAGNEAALRERIAQDAGDMQARLDLAHLLVSRGRHAEGMDELLEMVRRDRHWNDGAARKQLLAVFTLLGDAPLVGEYRRKLASALN